MSEFTRNLLLLACLTGAAAQTIPMPPANTMNQGVDPSMLHQYQQASRTLDRDPKDVIALISRGSVALSIAIKSPYDFFWVYRATKDLAQAVKIDPQNYYAHQNYGEAAYQAGDVLANQPNMRLAVAQFTSAIQLNPKAARSYMDRGWAYQMLGDKKHMQSDFDAALRLEPSLRSELSKESGDLARRRIAAASEPGTVDWLARYYIEASAKTQALCEARKGFWAAGKKECRVSLVLSATP